MSRPILKFLGQVALDVLTEPAKTWLNGIASEHARRFTERRWGPAPVEVEDAVLVDDNVPAGACKEGEPC